jgi:transmembrane sensor
MSGPAVSEDKKGGQGREMNNSLHRRAIEWHVRLRDGDDATWAAFAQWLEEDARHRQAYDAIEQTDLALEPLLPQVGFPKDTQADARPARRWWVAGGALAASIIAVLLFLPQLRSSRYEVSTVPGQRRTIVLDATTQVLLNGATRMIFDRENPRFAALTSGEALFRVRHDTAKPFTVEVGSVRIKDVGTVFNVVSDSGQVRVAVGEGEILYSTQSKEVPLAAGQALWGASDSATVHLSTAAPASVGAWQRGLLVYSGEPLSQVAADLGRSLGVPITVSSAIEARPFSGVIVLEGAGPQQLARLRLALHVDLEIGAAGWTMKPLKDGGS